jgi:hypothetical protein
VEIPQHVIQMSGATSGGIGSVDESVRAAKARENFSGDAACSAHPSRALRTEKRVCKEVMILFHGALSSRHCRERCVKSAYPLILTGDRQREAGQNVG